MTDIRFHDSRTRRKVAFRPRDPANVRMYVCGPTVYDRAHLGNARSAVVFDAAFRLLRHAYGAEHVTYVRNVTDVDDKINAAAAEQDRAIGEITAETSRWYEDDMAALGNLAPTHAPRATAYVPAMVDAIARLIETGHAYAAEGHVLFSVAAYPDYGALSGRATDDMIAGARVEVAPYKRGPLDFVLWKPSGTDLPGWDSPWGRGRPGWHIECSVMAHDLLGESFDIHGGGADLLFPHHENEAAQSACAYGGDFASVWLHNEMLRVEGEKMSKSLGNFFTVRDLLDDGVPGEAMRLVLLGTHYRKPMDWTRARAADATGTLRRWRAMTDDVAPGAVAPPVLDALADDLNTPGAIAALYDVARSGDAATLKASAGLLGLLDAELGAWSMASGPGEAVAAMIEDILAERAQAKADRDFARADALRDRLAAAGVVVRDRAGGSDWEIGADFDAARLEEPA